MSHIGWAERWAEGMIKRMHLALADDDWAPCRNQKALMVLALLMFVGRRAFVANACASKAAQGHQV